MTANFLSRNYPTACRSPLRIDQSRRRPPELRRYARHRHSLGSFGPRNKRGRRQSVLLRVPNRSSRAECRSPHSTSRHRATRRSDARHSSGCKQVAARWQESVLLTGAIERSISSVLFLFAVLTFIYSQDVILKSVKVSPSLVL